MMGGERRSFILFFGFAPNCLGICGDASPHPLHGRNDGMCYFHGMG